MLVFFFEESGGARGSYCKFINKKVNKKDTKKEQDITGPVGVLREQRKRGRKSRKLQGVDP